MSAAPRPPCVKGAPRSGGRLSCWTFVAGSCSLRECSFLDPARKAGKARSECVLSAEEIVTFLTRSILFCSYGRGAQRMADDYPGCATNWQAALPPSRSRGDSCCGARHLPAATKRLGICRPLPLASLPSSASGGGRVAPPLRNPQLRSRKIVPR